ncbi:hypothetical protein KY193_005499, partial [Citrobacter freundii]
MTGTVAASQPLTLRQPGMETRCPKVYRRAGQRQRSWLGAKHDSPGSRREVARVNQPVEKKYLKAPVFIVLVMV